MDLPSMPLRILALAPCMGPGYSGSVNDPVWVELDGLDHFIEKFAPTLSIPVSKSLCPLGEISITIKRIKDFKPEGLLKSVSYLDNLVQARKFVLEANSKNMDHSQIVSRLRQWPDLPHLELPEPGPSQPKKQGSSPVDDILKMVALPDQDTVRPPSSTGIVDVFDQLLRDILKTIFRNPDFRSLESVWRGFELLWKNARETDQVQVGMVPVDGDNLEKALEALTLNLAVNLPSIVLLDFPFDSSPRALGLLEQVAEFAQSLLVPSVVWIGPGFFNMETWKDLDRLPFLPHYLEEPHFGKWRTLCKRPASQWLSATCGCFLGRFPYGPENPGGPIIFDEGQNLWVSPVWGVGALIAKSHGEFGWPTRFTDWQRIHIGDLPVHQINSRTSIPLEISFPEDRLRQFVKANIMPLACAVNRDMIFSPFDRTIYGGSLGYQLFLSRITQLLLWCKDNFPPNLEAEQLQQGIERVFSTFWEKSGYQISNRLNISVYKPDAETQGQVVLTIDPPKEILSTGEKVALEIPW